MPKLSAEILGPIQGTQLFYPCSGDDLETPVKLFAPYITDFWFADVAYFDRIEDAYEQRCPTLTGLRKFVYLDREVGLTTVFDAAHDPLFQDIPPFVVTEWYEYLPTGTIITIHRCRRRGPSAMRAHITNLGVFFYRGTNSESSSTNWLYASRTHIQNKRHQMTWELLQNLKDGGLIVADGSDGKVACWIYKESPYQPFGLYTGDDHIQANAATHSNLFTDGFGHTFRCVGYAGERNGPTLVWQVKKRSPNGDRENSANSSACSAP